MLAHCFAHIRHPTFYEPILDSIEAVWDFFDPSACLEEKHPSHSFVQKYFPMVQEY